MGSLSASGTPLVKPTNILYFAHTGNKVRKMNTLSDVDTTVSNSGFFTAHYASGVIMQPGYSGLSSGIPFKNRELQWNILATGIESIERNKFTNASGHFESIVVRAEGIHTSVSKRQAEATGPMHTITERKVFFIDSDLQVTSGNYADWNIFTAAGLPVVSTSGTTDTDISPNATFNT